MSRDLFSGDQTKRPTRGNDYQPGKEPFDNLLIEDLIAEFCDTHFNYANTLDNYRVSERLQRRFPRDSDADGQFFIDTLIEDFDRSDAPDRYKEKKEFLINPVTQVLYDLGQTHVEVEFSHLTIPPKAAWDSNGILRFGVGLEGSPDRPLSITYLLPVGSSPMGRQAGRDTKHCHMDIFGKVGEIGMNAEDSSFYASFPPHYVGTNAAQSEFLLDGVEGVENFVSSAPNRYQFTFRHANGLVSVLLPDAFYEAKNTLFIPDGDGDWQEVRPHES